MRIEDLLETVTPSAAEAPTIESIESEVDRRQLRRRRIVGVATTACVILTVVIGTTRWPAGEKIDAVVDVPTTAEVEETDSTTSTTSNTTADVEACLASYETNADINGEQALSDFGIDLSAIDPTTLDVVVFRSVETDKAMVGLFGSGIFLSCTISATGSVDGFGMEVVDTEPGPPPDEIRVVTSRADGDEGTTNVRFEIVGQAGSDVIAIEAVLADGTVFAGQVSSGWFAVDGLAISNEAVENPRLTWTLANGSTESTPLGETDLPVLAASDEVILRSVEPNPSNDSYEWDLAFEIDDLDQVNIGRMGPAELAQSRAPGSEDWICQASVEMSAIGCDGDPGPAAVRFSGGSLEIGAWIWTGLARDTAVVLFTDQDGNTSWQRPLDRTVLFADTNERDNGSPCDCTFTAYDNNGNATETFQS